MKIVICSWVTNVDRSDVDGFHEVGEERALDPEHVPLEHLVRARHTLEGLSGDVVSATHSLPATLLHMHFPTISIIRCTEMVPCNTQKLCYPGFPTEQVDHTWRHNNHRSIGFSFFKTNQVTDFISFMSLH